MNKQSKLSLSPSAPRSQLNYNISLRNCYLRSKESLYNQLKTQKTRQQQTIRKKPIINKRNKQISIVDFSEIMVQKLKLPSIMKNGGTNLIADSSMLINDIQNFPPTKTQKRKFMRIPSAVMNSLKDRLNDLKKQSFQVNSQTILPKRMRQGKSLQVKRSKSILPINENILEQQIQPWDIDLQLGSTLQYFQKN